MFIRVKTSPNSPRESVGIVESFREGKKVHQRIVRHVGVAIDAPIVPASKEGVEFHPEAVAKVLRRTNGYP